MRKILGLCHPRATRCLVTTNAESTRSGPSCPPRHRVPWGAHGPFTRGSTPSSPCSPPSPRAARGAGPVPSLLHAAGAEGLGGSRATGQHPLPGGPVPLLPQGTTWFPHVRSHLQPLCLTYSHKDILYLVVGFRRCLREEQASAPRKLFALLGEEEQRYFPWPWGHAETSQGSVSPPAMKFGGAR